MKRFATIILFALLFFSTNLRAVCTPPQIRSFNVIGNRHCYDCPGSSTQNCPAIAVNASLVGPLAPGDYALNYLSGCIGYFGWPIDQRQTAVQWYLGTDNLGTGVPHPSNGGTDQSLWQRMATGNGPNFSGACGVLQAAALAGNDASACVHVSQPGSYLYVITPWQAADALCFNNNGAERFQLSGPDCSSPCWPPVSPTVTPTLTPVNCSARVQMQTVATAANSPFIHFKLRVYNDGSGPMQLSNLDLSYWFAGEGTGTPIVNRRRAFVGPRDISLLTRAQVRASNLCGQTNVVRIGFWPLAGVIAPLGFAEVEIRLQKIPGGLFNQSNDYSFDPALLSFANTPLVAAYCSGGLVWGKEPDCVPTPTATPTFTQTFTNTFTPTFTQTFTPTFTFTPSPCPPVSGPGWPMQGHDAGQSFLSEAVGPLTADVRWSVALPQATDGRFITVDTLANVIAGGLTSFNAKGVSSWTVGSVADNPGRPFEQPVLMGGLLYLPFYDSAVGARALKVLDPTNGNVVSETINQEYPTTLMGPVGANGKICFIGSSNGGSTKSVMMVDTSGTELWSKSLGSGLVGAMGPEGNVYVIERYGPTNTLQAFNVLGAPLWTLPVNGTYASVAVSAAGNIYVGFASGGMQSLRKVDVLGITQWEYSVATSTMTNFYHVVLAPGEAAYILSVQGYATMLNRVSSTGTLDWVVQVDKSYLSPPAVGPQLPGMVADATGRVYLSVNGTLSAVNSDGTIQWATTSTAVFGLALSHNGTLLVNDANAGPSLTAFGGDPCKSAVK